MNTVLKLKNLLYFAYTVEGWIDRIKNTQPYCRAGVGSVCQSERGKLRFQSRY